jgi:hypothetical protein
MSEDVLADLDVLRRRARGDRHAYAFPLFLFGTLILLAPLLYVSAPLPPGEFVQVDSGPFPQFTFGFYLKYQDLVGWYSTPALNLPVLFGSAALAAVAGLWSRRRTGWARTAGVACAAFFATVAFGALGVYLVLGHAALVIIAAALLMLAWAERSVLLTIVGVVFAGTALWVNLYEMQDFFYRLGWTGDWDSRVSALQTVLVPCVVLLAGGVAAVVGNRR